MCFLVVSISHSGCASVGSEGSLPIRFFFSDVSSSLAAEALMCLSSAEEALRVWNMCEHWAGKLERLSDLRLVQLVGGA